MRGIAIPYDASGNQTCDTDSYGTPRSYTFDAESRVTSITGAGTTAPFAIYSYDANGTRIRKDNADLTSTEYTYFNGHSIAEKDQAGAWTDYIYADGNRLARVQSAESVFQLSGTSTSAFSSSYTTAAPALSGYVFQSGDKLLVRQMQSGAATGGIRLIANGYFSDTYDQDGQWATNDEIKDTWHSRVFPLDALVGQSFTMLQFGCGSGAYGIGAYQVRYASIGVLSTDGTLRPIFNGSPSQTFQFLGWDSASTSGVQSVPAATASTVYYASDHLGTAQMEIGARGLPVWQGQFASFGRELDTQLTSNHYKFTGKERDQESGLDYFGARYYSSAMGRFSNPDPSGLVYADPTNPQSLNLYSYARNNPLIGTDPTGMAYCQWDDGSHDDSANTGVDGAVNSGSECTGAGGTWSHNDGHQ